MSDITTCQKMINENIKRLVKNILEKLILIWLLIINHFIKYHWMNMIILILSSMKKNNRMMIL